VVLCVHEFLFPVLPRPCSIAFGVQGATAISPHPLRMLGLVVLACGLPLWWVQVVSGSNGSHATGTHHATFSSPAICPLTCTQCR
jgi:uncharacterized protein YjeT (DUF2065 family)